MGPHKLVPGKGWGSLGTGLADFEHVYVQEDISTWAQRPEVSRGCPTSGASHLDFLGKIFLWYLGFTDDTDWLASESRIASCLHFPRAGITSMPTKPGFLKWVLGVELRSSSCLPSPRTDFFAESRRTSPCVILHMACWPRPG